MVFTKEWWIQNKERMRTLLKGKCKNPNPWAKGLTKETDERVKLCAEKKIGQKRSEESKKRMSIAAKQRKIQGHTGCKQSEETKQKISDKVKIAYIDGRLKSPFKLQTYEDKLKMVQIRKERNHYNRTEEQNKKLSNSIKGEKNHAWIKDRSFLIYPDEFNRELKEQIRQRDQYRCQQCFRHQDELYSPLGRKYKLTIHHIDYNKKNNKPENLLSMCKICHGQTNFKREDWTNYFQDKVLR